MSDYETTQRRRNITVGIFVVIALCALVWLIFMFNELPRRVTGFRSMQILVQFPTAQGVQEDTPVQFCGYQVGRVTHIMPPEPRFDPLTGKTYHQTLCVLGIDRKYKDIPSNVSVRVMTRGLGSSFIEMKVDPKKELTALDPNRPETVYLFDGALLQGSAGMASEFIPAESQEKIDILLTSLTELIGNANDIIGDKASKDNLKNTLANLEKTTAVASEMVEQFKLFAVSGTETSEELSKAIAEIRLLTEKINSGQGTAGMFLTDGRFYENLLENTEQLRILLEDVKNLIAQYRAKGIKIKL
ncbi:MAG: MlaD family protein [Phycisphaerae bacterium]